MVASHNGAEKEEEEARVGISAHDWRVRIEHTTIHGFRALLSIGLGIRVTTRGAASHCALDSRFTGCHSAFFGTATWITLYPIA